MHPDRPQTYGPCSSVDWVLAQKISSMDFIVYGLDVYYASSFIQIVYGLDVHYASSFIQIV